MKIKENVVLCFKMTFFTHTQWQFKSNEILPSKKNSNDFLATTAGHKYRSDMANSNMVNLKFHLIQTFCYIFANSLSFQG